MHIRFFTCHRFLREKLPNKEINLFKISPGTFFIGQFTLVQKKEKKQFIFNWLQFFLTGKLFTFTKRYYKIKQVQ